MFTDKLEFYGKSCKWLNFYLNVAWPVLAAYSLYMIVVFALNWQTISTAVIVVNVWLIVGYLAGDLFTRFLDRAAYGWWIAANAWPILCNIVLSILASQAVKADAAKLLASDTSTASGTLSAGIGFLTGSALSSLHVIIGVGMAVNAAILLAVNCVYASKRKDLFYSSEDALERA